MKVHKQKTAYYKRARAHTQKKQKTASQYDKIRKPQIFKSYFLEIK